MWLSNSLGFIKCKIFHQDDPQRLYSSPLLFVSRDFPPGRPWQKLGKAVSHSPVLRAGSDDWDCEEEDEALRCDRQA
jgi:hypothetical protein